MGRHLGDGVLIAKLGGPRWVSRPWALLRCCMPDSCPLCGSLTVSGLDDRPAIALFVPGTVVRNIVVEGRPITRAKLVPAGGIGPAFMVIRAAPS